MRNVSSQYVQLADDRSLVSALRMKLNGFANALRLYCFLSLTRSLLDMADDTRLLSD